jgi:hypothetical protein
MPEVKEPACSPTPPTRPAAGAAGAPADPGGNQIPGGPPIHVFPPGPTDVTLPFSGGTLQGLDVEPASSPTIGTLPPWPTTPVPPRQQAVQPVTGWRGRRRLPTHGGRQKGLPCPGRSVGRPRPRSPMLLRSGRRRWHATGPRLPVSRSIIASAPPHRGRGTASTPGYRRHGRSPTRPARTPPTAARRPWCCVGVGRLLALLGLGPGPGQVPVEQPGSELVADERPDRACPTGRPTARSWQSWRTRAECRGGRGSAWAGSGRSGGSSTGRSGRRSASWSPPHRGRSGDWRLDREARNHGCWSEVWANTRSVRAPRTSIWTPEPPGSSGCPHAIG